MEWALFDSKIKTQERKINDSEGEEGNVQVRTQN